MPMNSSYGMLSPFASSSLSLVHVEAGDKLLWRVLDSALVECSNEHLRDILRHRNGRRHREGHANPRCVPDSPLHEHVVQQERTLERSGRTLERMPKHGNENRPRVEVRKNIMQPLGSRERVILIAALLEARRGRKVVLRSQSDDEDVGLVRVLVRSHSPVLRVDEAYALLTKLDPLLRDVAIAQTHIVRGLAAQQHIQLREPEME